MRDEFICHMNGKFQPVTKAAVSISDYGLLSGITITDQARTYDHVPFRLDQHLERFCRGCAAVGIGLQQDVARLRVQAMEVLRHNLRLTAADDELALVIFATPGENRAYSHLEVDEARPEPTVCIHTYPLALARWRSAIETGIPLVIPSTRQLPTASVPPQIKTRSRLHWWLAQREATASHPQSLPLCLDINGFLTETPVANLLLISQGTLLSPLSERILPGISREETLRLAEQLSIPWSEADLTCGDLLCAQEAWLTGTSFGILPVGSVNGAPIGSGLPGPVYNKMVAAWSERVGLNIKEQITNWKGK